MTQLLLDWDARVEDNDQDKDALTIAVEYDPAVLSYADLLAKFLLMFVYVASVNNHSTHRQIHHATGASPLAAAVPGVAPAVGVPLPANGVALR